MSNKPGKTQDLIDAKFLEERKVFLWGEVNDKSAKHVIDRLLTRRVFLHFFTQKNPNVFVEVFLRAGDRVRTGDIQLGRLTLYQLSYSRLSSANIKFKPFKFQRKIKLFRLPYPI